MWVFGLGCVWFLEVNKYGLGTSVRDPTMIEGERQSCRLEGKTRQSRHDQLKHGNNSLGAADSQVHASERWPASKTPLFRHREVLQVQALQTHTIVDWF